MAIPSLFSLLLNIHQQPFSYAHYNIQQTGMDYRKPKLMAPTKLALSQSQRIPRSIEAYSKGKKTSTLKESNRKKSHSKNGVSIKNSRSKGKNYNFHKSLLFCQYDKHQNRNSRKIAFIPEAIRFKEGTEKTNLNAALMRSHKRKRRSTHCDNKQNCMNNNYLDDKLIPNRDLIRTSLKPNKVNFMNRVSTVYDLILSKVMLPQFVEYFLGQALYVIREKINQLNKTQERFYDWKLDQFKQICQKIYESSGEEDLKYFMGLSLPTVSRWHSRPSSTKMGSSLPANTMMTTHTDSRMTEITNSENRVSYFKSLNRKDRFQLGEQRQSIDILDKLNSKLDNYLKTNYQIDQFERKRELRPSFGFPLQLNNI